MLDNLFIFICFIGVAALNAGFGTLEASMCQEKNTVNVLTKNLLVFVIAVIAYYFVGYKIMFPTEAIEGNEMFFLFQSAFVATSCSIISGAVAERIKLISFLIFSTVMCGVIYPFSGNFVWSSGAWLTELGFTDFAGSTVVHSVGAMAALAGIIVLGKRRKGLSIPGHNLSLGFIGLFILWLGWFFFNAGSELAFTENIGSITLVTLMGSIFGCFGTYFLQTLRGKKPDLGYLMNGVLAGLVSITAGANVLTIEEAMITGFIAGIVVVSSVETIKKLKLDDVVGAISVHGTCGILGTLAVGVFGHASILSQLLGIGVINTYVLIVSIILWLVLKLTIGIRVSEREETLGLDLSEHDSRAYPDFVIDNVGMR